jgi:hypothetical protein
MVRDGRGDWTWVWGSRDWGYCNDGGEADARGNAEC